MNVRSSIRVARKLWGGRVEACHVPITVARQVGVEFRKSGIAAPQLCQRPTVQMDPSTVADISFAQLMIVLPQTSGGTAKASRLLLGRPSQGLSRADKAPSPDAIRSDRGLATGGLLSPPAASRPGRACLRLGRGKVSPRATAAAPSSEFTTVDSQKGLAWMKGTSTQPSSRP